ncbi:MAG TPA: PaaI family thioesterase [Blastocatellia bacterium]|nr:PaaI family thioesterase [Blastocatellia bacterium]
MVGSDFTALREIFKAAPFIRSLGMELASLKAGECSSTLEVRTDHLQQNGVVHAAVLTALADHTAGGAAASVLPAGSYPLTAEISLTLLRSAKAARLRCVARVLKAGRAVVFVESEVLTAEGESSELLVKALVTLAVVTPGGG